MDFKELGIIIGGILTLFIMIPLFFQLLDLNANILKDPSSNETTESMAKIIGSAIVPWWLGILEWLASINGILGTLLVLGFIFFLKWMGEVN